MQSNFGVSFVNIDCFNFVNDFFHNVPLIADTTHLEQISFMLLLLCLVFIVKFCFLVLVNYKQYKYSVYDNVSSENLIIIEHDDQYKITYCSSQLHKQNTKSILENESSIYHIDNKTFYKTIKNFDNCSLILLQNKQ